MGPSSVPNEERWSENNVDHLREALTRFAHELDQISNNVQARTTKMISTDIRRRHMAPQRPVASAISTLKRQPTRLGPVIVPKRLNVTRSATRPQYVPGRLATAPPAISQVIVPTTKAYPMTRTTSSTFAGQRQYLMPLTQPGPPTHFGASDNGRCPTAIGSADMIPVRTFSLSWGEDIGILSAVR
nr:MLL1/MLL complex subunit [Haemonchus contortus]